MSGIIATHRIASVLSGLVERRAAPGAGGAVRVLSTVVGYLFVVLAVLAVLEVQSNTLVGAGVAGVVLGIAAQQSLGNVFAGLVLLVARPFVIGDHIRIRSGALGGIFEASVSEMSLTYVTLRTDDGLLKIPNSAMLAAGVGHLSPAASAAGLYDCRSPGHIDGRCRPTDSRAGRRTLRATARPLSRCGRLCQLGHRRPCRPTP